MARIWLTDVDVDRVKVSHDPKVIIVGFAARGYFIGIGEGEMRSKFHDPDAKETDDSDLIGKPLN
jgi:hypothetical protein